MKIKKVIFFGFYFLFLICTSCNNQQNINTIDSSIKTYSKQGLSDYYPVTLGRTWTYKLEQFQDEQPNTKFKEMSMTVINYSQKDESAVLKRFYPDSTIQPNQTMAKINQENIELSRYIQQSVFNALQPESISQIKGKDSIIILKTPLVSGTTWEGRIFQGGTEQIQITGYENLDTPAGSFDSIKVHHHLRYQNGKEDNLYYWYALGIGMVKMHEELTISIGNKWVKLKSTGILKSFS